MVSPGSSRSKRRELDAAPCRPSASRPRSMRHRSAVGDEVTWEARHLGVRRRLTARISRLERPTLFEDVMVRGPVASLRHVHEFVPHDGGTTMIDTFTFASPLGPIGLIVDRLFLAGYMERFLLSRAHELKRMAESP